MDKEVLDNIHFKVGKLCEFAENWEKNCKEKHTYIDNRFQKIDGQVKTFTYSLFGVMVVVILKLMLDIN